MFYGEKRQEGFFDIFNSFSIPIGENNENIKSVFEKMQSYLFMLAYLQNLTYSIFDFKGFAEANEREGVNLDEDFFKKTILDNGKIAVLHTDSGIQNLPIVISKVNQYHNATAFSIVNQSDSQNGVIFEAITPKDYTLETSNKAGDGVGAFEIVYLNPSHLGLFPIMQHYAGLYAMSDKLLQNNLFARSLQTIIEASADKKVDVKYIVDAIFNQNGILALSSEKARTVSELLQNNPNTPEWVCDKVCELQQNIINKYLAHIGINHIPYEKRERLTNEEIKTNDMSLDLIRKSYLNTIQDGLDRANKRFNLNLSVSLAVSEPIEQMSENSEEIEENTEEGGE